MNVPVKLFSAVSAKGLHFHMLHGKDNGRIKQKRVCSVDGEEVPFDQVVKGYKLSHDRYVVLGKDELEKFDPKSTKTIDIEDFVDLKDIDPIFYQTTYYLVPDKEAGKAYSLLFYGMNNTDKVGIARMVMRTKGYLCAVRVMGESLALSTLIFSDEIVPQSSIDELEHATVKPNLRELQMATQLIESLSVEVDLSKYKDDYREKVLHLIHKKAEGKEVEVPKEERAPGKVVNLIDVLKASLKARAGAKKIVRTSKRSRA